jgi:hypothetical protein
MYLRAGCEWEEREEYNLCHECALMVIHEMRSNDQVELPPNGGTESKKGVVGG